MKKFSPFLIVLLLMLTSFTAGAQEYPRGDVNQDGAVNISDVTCLIDNLLSGVPEGDVNQDGVANISDVTSLIDYLLSGSWPYDPVMPPDTHEYVDLGLPSGTLWATCNVGASAPEEYGDYFAWGETAPKEVYNNDSYKWYQCDNEDCGYTKYCTKSSLGFHGFTDGKTELDPADDAAYVNWGPSWRMPSREQQDELLVYCTWLWTQINGVNGHLVTGPNGNTLFLPAAGSRIGRWLYFTGSSSTYLSRMLGGDIYYSFALCLAANNWIIASPHREEGFSIRAVHVS